MLGLPALVAGLVLWFAGPWFEDQVVVGQILTGVGALVVLIQFLVFAAAAAAVNNTKNRRW